MFAMPLKRDTDMDTDTDGKESHEVTSIHPYILAQSSRVI